MLTFSASARPRSTNSARSPDGASGEDRGSAPGRRFRRVPCGCRCRCGQGPGAWRSRRQTPPPAGACRHCIRHSEGAPGGRHCGARRSSRPRGLGEPHRQHAAPQRKIARLAGGKVGRIGERHQKISAPNRCCHFALSIAMPRGERSRFRSAGGVRDYRHQDASAVREPRECQGGFRKLRELGAIRLRRIEISPGTARGATMSVVVQVLGCRQSQGYPHTQEAGVRKAPMHEVAASGAPGGDSARNAWWGPDDPRRDRRRRSAIKNESRTQSGLMSSGPWLFR